MSLITSTSHATVNEWLKSANGGNVIDLSRTGALLRVGEYVLFDAPPNDLLHPLFEDKDVHCVGQIIDIVELRDIEKDEMGDEFWKHNCAVSNARDRYARMRLMPFVDELHHKLDTDVYQYVPSSLREVECSSQVFWIDEKHIKSIAFVFHLDQVQACRYACSGINNAFFVRRCVHSESGEHSYINTHEYDPFVSPTATRAIQRECGIVLHLSRNCVGEA